MANLLDGAAATRDQPAARALIELVAPFADQVIVPMAASVEGGKPVLAGFHEDIAVGARLK